MTWRRPSSLENSKSFLIHLRMVTQQVNVITAFSQSKIIKFLRLYNVRMQIDPVTEADSPVPTYRKNGVYCSEIFTFSLWINRLCISSL